MKKIVSITNEFVAVDDIQYDITVDDYNGVSNVSGKQIQKITFDEFLTRYKISKIDELYLGVGNRTINVLKQIFRNNISIGDYYIQTWNDVPDKDKATITKHFCDANVLFETCVTGTLFYTNTINKHRTVPSIIPTQTTGAKKYNVQFTTNTDLDVIATLYSTFVNVSDIIVTPVYEPKPIIFDGNVCVVDDYTLVVSESSISLTFQTIGREVGVRYEISKPLDITQTKSWLQTMDSEQVYQMAKLTFNKIK